MTEGLAADRQIESAARTFGEALRRVRTGDFATAAALLRCTARYLESASGQEQSLAVSAVPR